MSQEKNVSKRSNIPKLSYFRNDLKKIDIQEVYRYRKKKSYILQLGLQETVSWWVCN